MSQELFIIPNHITYCEEFRFRMRIQDVLKEADAQKRFDCQSASGWDGVFNVVFGSPSSPAAFMEVRHAAEFINYNILDSLTRVVSNLGFTPLASRPNYWFLSQATFTEYRGDSQKPWEAMSYGYAPDGTIGVRYDGPEPMDLKVGQTTGDVSDHWEAAPVFGEWERFARPDRRIARPPLPTNFKNAQQAYDEQRQINAAIRAQIDQARGKKPRDQT